MMSTRKPNPNRLFEGVWPIVGERSFSIGAGGDDLEAARSAGFSAHLHDGGDLARLVRSLLAQSTQAATERHPSPSA